jgi:hypothetical protein
MRTTLRVPADLAEKADGLARVLGTTANDALIRMAERGALLYAQEVQMAQAAEHQLAAILDAHGEIPPDAEYLAPEAWREAALALRTGRFGPI